MAKTREINRVLRMTDEQIRLANKHRMSRRDLLRYSGSALVGGLVLAACRGIGDDEADLPAAETAPDDGPGRVNFLGWEGFDLESARGAFAAAGGVLSATYIGNNDEILARLRGATGTFDVVTPNAAFLPPLAGAGVIEPLDYDRLPSTNEYFPEFYKPDWNTFDGSTWGAPVQWGNGPLVYRPDLLDELPTSWFDLQDPKYKDQVGMWDDGFGHIVVMAKALGFDPPYRLTEEQLDRVVEELIKIRDNSRLVAPSLGDLADTMARGEIALTTQSWQGVASMVREAGETAEWLVPEEGTWGWCDHYCLAKDAPNPDGTYEFINAMISPEGNAEITNLYVSGTPVQGAVPLLDPEVQDEYTYDNVQESLDDLGFYSLPPLEEENGIRTYDQWNQAWARVRG